MAAQEAGGLKMVTHTIRHVKKTQKPKPGYTSSIMFLKRATVEVGKRGGGWRRQGGGGRGRGVGGGRGEGGRRRGGGCVAN